MELPTEPLAFQDFSGGITDNIMQGDPRRAEKLDNLFIRDDHKLEERPPFVAIDTVNYLLPSGLRRANIAFTAINQTLLFLGSARNLYTIDPSTGVWIQPAGKGGNEPLQGGDVYSQAQACEFQRIVYLTSDGAEGSNGTQPSKIYRDDSNVWVAKTAGLPRAFAAALFTDTTLLQACITLANALRTSFLAHMADVGGASSHTNLHKLLDKYSLSYLTAETYAVSDPELLPSPPPTPAPAASDQATLYALTQALALSYCHHTFDPTVNNFYHFDVFYDPGGSGAITDWNVSGTVPVKGPQIPPIHIGAQSTGVFTFFPITSPTDCAAILDDLWLKWYLHINAPSTHSQNNDIAQFYNKYLPTTGQIGTVSLVPGAPRVTPDFTDLFKYANALKYMYNSHILYGVAPGLTNTQHQYNPPQPSNDMRVPLPDCNSLASFYNVIYWIRANYSQHFFDANLSVHQNISWSSTSGSTSITSVVNTDTSGAYTIPVGSWIICSSDNFNGDAPGLGFLKSKKAARVTASGSGTATLDRTASASTTQTGQASGSFYHEAWSALGALTSSTTSQVVPGDQMSLAANSFGTDPASWLLLAGDFLNAFGSHLANIAIHGSSSTPYFTLGASSYSAVAGWNFFVPSVSTVAYAFFYSDTYTVEHQGIEYEVDGNPVFTASLTVGQSFPIGYTVPSLNTAYYPDAVVVRSASNAISGIPALTNDESSNYDVGNVKLNIYRTTSGGTDLFLLASLANGVTTYTDQLADSISVPGIDALDTKQAIYTQGGIVGRDQPPQCKYMHLLPSTSTMYYGAITDTGQYLPNRIVQAVQFAPDHAPATFFVDLPDELRGISSARSTLVALCSTSIYRVTGGFTPNGQGAMSYESISDEMGCLNSQSIVRTEIGVFFAGSDGFYYTDGFQLIKISLELNKTYLSITKSDAQKRNIKGAYDKDTRRIWWTVTESDSGAENTAVYVFYLNFGVKPSGVFSTVSNGFRPGETISTIPVFQPASLVFQNGTAYIGHGRGYALRSDPLNKMDRCPTDGVDPSSWPSLTIPYNYTSCALDAGTTFKRKWLTKIHLIGQNSGNQSIHIDLIRDLNSDNKGYKALVPVNYTDNLVWGDPGVTWGDSDTVWKLDGKMDLWRRFPQTALRSDLFQIQMVPAYLAVYSSSMYPDGCTATVSQVSGSNWKALIATPSGYTSILWPAEVAGMVVAFESDGYINEYPIVSVNNGIAGQLLFVDSAGTGQAGSGQGWVVRGMRKQQRFRLDAMDIHYTYLGDKNQAFPGRTTADGAGNLGENPS